MYLGSYPKDADLGRNRKRTVAGHIRRMSSNASDHKKKKKKTCHQNKKILRVRARQLAPGERDECPFGGVKLRIGKKSTFICNGAPGAQGLGVSIPGQPGPAGPPGGVGTPVYGEIFLALDASGEQPITVEVFTPYLLYTNAGVAVQTVPNPAAGAITVLSTGVYRVAYSVSFTVSAAAPTPPPRDVQFAVAVNGAVQPNIQTVSTPTPVQVGSFGARTSAASGFLALTSGDVVQLFVRIATAIVGTATLNALAATFNVQRIA